MATVPLPQPPALPDLPSRVKYLQEDELNQECKDFISSVPREEGWMGISLHQYQGFWIPTWAVQGVLSFQKHFKAQDTDILLATLPKSGTTWMKAISFALAHRMRYSNTRQHPLLNSNSHVLVPSMESVLYNGEDVPDLSSFIPPRIFSTHFHYSSLPISVKDSACKIVYLCRNPKDTFVSHWHFNNRLRPNKTSVLEKVFDEFCEGVSGFGPYWDHVLGYWKESLENPHKVLFLKFEDMKEQPIANLRRIAEFLGCPFSSEEEANDVVNDISMLCSFDNLSNLEVNKSGKNFYERENNAFFRQGEVGDWTNYLTREMVEKLDRITEERFKGTGIRF